MVLTEAMADFMTRNIDEALLLVWGSAKTYVFQAQINSAKGRGGGCITQLSRRKLSVNNPPRRRTLRGPNAFNFGCIGKPLLMFRAERRNIHIRREASSESQGQQPANGGEFHNPG